MNRECCELCCENFACQRVKEVRCSAMGTSALGGRASPMTTVAAVSAQAPTATAIETICDSSTIPVIEDDSDYGHVDEKHQKYVVFCLICGIGSFLIGSLFLVIAFLFRSYTTTLEYFETVPSYAPSILLLFMGFLLIILANYRYRFSCLIKLCGAVCLVTAYICVQITVTTTLIHMNRLQTLQECAFTQSTRTCTCYGPVPTSPPVPSPAVSSIRNMLPTDSSLSESVSMGAFFGDGDDANDANDDDNNNNNEEFHIDSSNQQPPPLTNSNRFVFEAVANCAIVHGSLYACLRAAFGISVIAVLLCVFSFMLIYQLFSHEKKKRYLDELNARLNLFDQRPMNPVNFSNPVSGGAVNSYCNYCGEFRTSAAAGTTATAATANSASATTIPSSQQSFMQWDPNVPIDIFWNSRRVGNYYSPNPIERRTSASTSTQNNNTWRNWYRLPWLRSHVSNTISDCQYGFNETSETATVPDESAASHERPNTENSSEPGSRNVCNHSWGPPPPYTNSPRRLCCPNAASNPIFLPRLLQGSAACNASGGHSVAPTNTLVVNADCTLAPDNTARAEIPVPGNETATSGVGEQQPVAKARDEAEDYFADESSGSGYNDTNSSKTAQEPNDHQYEVIPETVGEPQSPTPAGSKQRASSSSTSSSRTKRKHLRQKTVPTPDESDHTADSGWQSELYPSSGTAKNQNISNSIHV